MANETLLDKEALNIPSNLDNLKLYGVNTQENQNTDGQVNASELAQALGAQRGNIPITNRGDLPNVAFTLNDEPQPLIDALNALPLQVVPHGWIGMFSTVRITATSPTSFIADKRFYVFASPLPGNRDENYTYYGQGSGTPLTTANTSFKRFEQLVITAENGVISNTGAFNLGHIGTTSIADAVNNSTETYTGSNGIIIVSTTDENGEPDQFYIYNGSENVIGNGGNAVTNEDFTVVDPATSVPAASDMCPTVLKNYNNGTDEFQSDLVIDWGDNLTPTLTPEGRLRVDASGGGSSLNLGSFDSQASLETAHPSPVDNSSAYIDVVGEDRYAAYWDNTENKWTYGENQDLSGKEDFLGNPTADGQVLSSTISGQRTWIDPATGGSVTDAEVETAYNNQVSKVNTTEITDATQEDVRRFSPKDIKEISVLHGKESTVNTYYTGASADNAFKADLKARKNKFNKNTVTPNTFMVDDTGNTSTSTAYQLSDFIPVTEAVQYAFNFNVRFLAQFDENQTLITGDNENLTSYTPPVNVAFVRISIFTVNLNEFQMEVGSASTSFEDYVFVVPEEQLLLTEYVKTSELETTLDGVVPFLTYGSNLYDFENADTPASNVFVNYVTGGYSASAIYDATGFIELPNDIAEITVSFKHQLHFYDENKVSISGSNSTVLDRTVAVPVGAKYVNCTVLSGASSSFMVSVGQSNPSVYVPYKIPLKDINSEVFQSEVIQDVSFGEQGLVDYLPSKVYVAVGRTIELYNNQVVSGISHDDFEFVWTFVGGKSLKRKFSYTGVSGNIGSNNLRLRIYNQVNRVIFDKTIIVEVAAATITTPFTICPIGDSLTNSKPWLTEVESLSSGNITFEGTRGDGAFESKHEGRSGWRAALYLGNNSYTFDSTGIDGVDGRTQNLNPFYNTAISDVDFDYYKSNYNQNPDALMIWLGTNDVQTGVDVAINDISSFINKLIATGASALKIFIVHTITRPDQNSIGVFEGTNGRYKLGEDLKVMELQKGLVANFENNANVFFVPALSCHDSEYNYGETQVAVNPRSSITETYAIESVHPQTAGYLQIADVIFSTLVANQ